MVVVVLLPVVPTCTQVEHTCMVQCIYAALPSGEHKCMVQCIYAALPSGEHKCMVQCIYAALPSGEHKCMVQCIYMALLHRCRCVQLYVCHIACTLSIPV